MARRPASKNPKNQITKGVPSPTSRVKPPKWMETPGMLIAGRSVLDEADALEVEMQQKWGRDRLRLLVDSALREKFDRQRYLTNQARWHGDLEDVRREGARMATAWRALDKAACASGCAPLDPSVWETQANGVAVVIVREAQLANRVQLDGRAAMVLTLEEVGSLIARIPELVRAKEVFPGCEVTPSRHRVHDPLATPIYDGDEGVADTDPPIDGTVVDEVFDRN